MRYPTWPILAWLAFVAIAVPGARAQTAQDLVGTWTLESDISTSADGHRLLPFGSDPRGIAIFDADGHFAIVISRPDLPKFASANRMQGTAQENEALVHGSFAFFGTYAVANRVVIQHIEGGTWPGWVGTDERRTIASFAQDEQTWTTVSSFGANSVLRWARAKPRP